MKILARICALVCVLELGVCLSAQVATGTSPDTAVAANANAMAAALNVRSEITNTVFSGEATPEEAISELRANNAPLGLGLDPDAELSLAAIDIGQRLIVLGKPKEAEDFFWAAEQSLDALVQRTEDTQRKDKALYLAKLAFVRGNYLNKAAQAKTDIEQAIALQPEDKNYQRAKRALAKTHAPITVPATPRS